MSKKNLIRDSYFPYHLTARSNNRELFPSSLDQVYKIMTNELGVQTELRNIRIHSFVLMPNHFHLLLTTPDSNLDIVMCEFMKTTARKLNSISGRSGHIYGGRYYWSLIQTERYFSHAFRYVFQNPVRANLCKNVEEYQFSSIQDMFGLSKPQIKLWPCSSAFSESIPSDHWALLEWLNYPYQGQQVEVIKKALRRKFFEFPKDRSTRIKLDWEVRFDANLNQKGAGPFLPRSLD